MSTARTLLLRWLPPLVVAGGLAAILWNARETGGRAREREEDVLRARVAEPTSRTTVGRDVEGYLARYGSDPEARWFAIDLHARRFDVASALAAFQGDPDVRDAPGAAKRFAVTLLRHLGARPPEGLPGTWLFPHALLARLDFGDPEASVVLDRLTAAITPGELVNYYQSAHRAATPGSHAMATAWMRRDSDPLFLAAASTILARPGARDLADRIRPIVESPWRTERPLLWTHLTRALGTVGDPASLDALRRELALVSGDGLDERRRRLGCDVGLAVAGDAQARDEVLRALEDRANDWAGAQMAIGLFARLEAGDAAAIPVLAQLAQRESAPTTRLQIGMCTVVSEKMPEGVPADGWVADLAGSPVRTARVLTHVWALRHRDPGAVAALLADLSDAVRGHDVAAEAVGPDDDRGAAVIEVLRGLARWG